jgi:hypothetical protein
LTPSAPAGIPHPRKLANLFFARPGGGITAWLCPVRAPFRGVRSRAAAGRHSASWKFILLRAPFLSRRKFPTYRSQRYTPIYLHLFQAFHHLWHYGVHGWNCEHWARLVVSGDPVSYQFAQTGWGILTFSECYGAIAQRRSIWTTMSQSSTQNICSAATVKPNQSLQPTAGRSDV